MRQQFLVERTPVGADADTLAVLRGELDDSAELPVLLLAEADIARIDAVFVERLGAGGMVGQQLVADIVEIAHERHVDAAQHQPVADVRYGGRRLVAVHRDADDLGAGAPERRDLADGGLDVGRVRVGHGLDDDRMTAADHHRSDGDRDGPAPGLRAGASEFGGQAGRVHAV